MLTAIDGYRLVPCCRMATHKYILAVGLCLVWPAFVYQIEPHDKLIFCHTTILRNAVFCTKVKLWLRVPLSIRLRNL